MISERSQDKYDQYREHKSRKSEGTCEFLTIIITETLYACKAWIGDLYIYRRMDYEQKAYGFYAQHTHTHTLDVRLWFIWREVLKKFSWPIQWINIIV